MSLEEFVKKHRNTFDDKKMPELVSLDFEETLKKGLHQDLAKRRHLRLFRHVSVAASLILVVTLVYSYQNRQERIAMRDNLVSALDESETNSSRLEAIYDIEDKFGNEKEDERILNAYFKILHDDSGVNSKTAVIDALLKFPDNPLMRNELIVALGNEKEPLVQLKLINSISKFREQRAKVPLKKIIEDKESLPLVKGNASALLAMLNQ